MEEGKMPDNHLTSAVAFVEGGIQDACDDACSICLEEFCESDPSAVTNCKHEFHLQCVLEWCQRSSKCPMCWQNISLKDPGSQELLDAVENERNIRMNPPRSTTIFHHPTLGDFELQHLPAGGATEAELEERIIQHLAAAAAMGRTRHTARREGGQRGRASSGHGRPHFLVFSSHPNAPSPAGAMAGSTPTDGSVSVTGDASTSPLVASGGDLYQMLSSTPGQVDQVSASASGPTGHTNQHGPLNNRLPVQTNPNNQDRAGPSDFHSFSESLKSRISSVSMRYKDSIIKSTRGWRERLLSRSNPQQDLTVDERREENTGIATLSQMMERIEARDNSGRNETASVVLSNVHPVEETNQPQTETTNNNNNHPFTEEANAHAPFGTSSAANGQ